LSIAARQNLWSRSTPSENTVRFYLSRGFQPLAELTAELFELEPEAVRMSKSF